MSIIYLREAVRNEQVSFEQHALISKEAREPSWPTADATAQYQHRSVLSRWPLGLFFRLLEKTITRDSVVCLNYICRCQSSLTLLNPSGFILHLYCFHYSPNCCRQGWNEKRCPLLASTCNCSTVFFPLRGLRIGKSEQMVFILHNIAQHKKIIYWPWRCTFALIPKVVLWLWLIGFSLSDQRNNDCFPIQKLIYSYTFLEASLTGKSNRTGFFHVSLCTGDWLGEL